MQRLLSLALIPVLLAPPASTHAQTTQRDTALSYEQQGNLPEAESAWHAILKAHPNDAEAYAHLGLIAGHQEHYKEAATLYRKALALSPSQQGVRLNLGLALFKAGEMKEAVPVFAQLLKSAPADSPDAQRYTILLAMSHYGAAQYAEAVPLLKQAAANDAQNLAIRMTLAHSCLWSRQFQCVLDTYHEILSLNAESAEADMLAGEASDELHDRGGAIEQFRAAVKANPTEPNVHFGLGYLLWTQRLFEEAITELQAELVNDPQHAQAMLYLGDAYTQLNQPEKARPLLEKALTTNPSFWRAHLDLGILDAAAGHNDEALRHMEQAAKLQPNEVNIHMRLGRLYKAMGNNAQAKAEFAKANNLTHAADEGVLKEMTPKSQPAPSPTPQ